VYACFVEALIFVHKDMRIYAYTTAVVLMQSTSALFNYMTTMQVFEK
jgi:hypothetical protein